MGVGKSQELVKIELNSWHKGELIGGYPENTKKAMESRKNIKFLSKGWWTYGPTLYLSINTHICSNFYRVVYFWDDSIKIRAYVSIYW